MEQSPQIEGVLLSGELMMDGGEYGFIRGGLAVRCHWLSVAPNFVCQQLLICDPIKTRQFLLDCYGRNAYCVAGTVLGTGTDRVHLIFASVSQVCFSISCLMGEEAASEPCLPGAQSETAGRLRL